MSNSSKQYEKLLIIAEMIVEITDAEIKNALHRKYSIEYDKYMLLASKERSLHVA